MNRLSLWAFASLAVMAAGAATLRVAAEPTEPATEPAVYVPVTGDLMNAYVQPRHTKLFLAGQAKNWKYAEYERSNIGGALARWGKAIPLYEGRSVPPMVAALIAPRLASLQAAIAARDEAAFTDAYDGLTTGCNQCHAAMGHAFIVIDRPGSAAFSDQVFAPRPTGSPPEGAIAVVTPCCRSQP